MKLADGHWGEGIILLEATYSTSSWHMIYIRFPDLLQIHELTYLVFEFTKGAPYRSAAAIGDLSISHYDVLGGIVPGNNPLPFGTSMMLLLMVSMAAMPI